MSTTALTKKLPSQVFVLGIAYKVVYQAELKNNSETVHGWLDDNNRIIYINTDFPDTMQTTLTHEYLHAALYQSGVSTLLKHKVEEAVVMAIETALEGKVLPWKAAP